MSAPLGTPAASSPQVRVRMLATRQQDTKAELDVRSRLHALGLRYRVNSAVVAGLRRRADIVFSRPKVAVFVDGCFWHSCPQHHTNPKANAAWWSAKLDANRARDADTDRRLEAAGWSVIHVWEHEDPEVAAGRIADHVRSRWPLT